MKTWSFYGAATGLVSGKQYSGPTEMLKENTPPGCMPIEGRYDRLRQRVDLATGSVIEDLSLGLERDRERRRDATLQQIAELERRQARPQRELLLDPTNAQARERLQAIDAQIAVLRPRLG